MILGDVMEEIAESAKSLDLRTFAYPPDNVNPPAFMVGLPENLDPHGTYSEGMQILYIPAFLLVGRLDDRSSHKRIVSYMDGSLVTAVESYDYTSCDDVTVLKIEFDAMTFAKIDYLGAELSIMAGGAGS